MSTAPVPTPGSGGFRLTAISAAYSERRVFWLAFGLFLFVLVVFFPAAGFEFSNFDDQAFVSGNLSIQDGITWHGLNFAFRTQLQAWTPVLWLSYMLDAELFGKSSVGFHLTNILIHAVNAVLVFVLLVRMIGSVPIALVSAAVFALHPLRVESVAWVVERRGLLASFFLLLALHAYVHFTREHNARWYSLVTVAFALSLMAKPIWASLPLLLMVLDYWPLRRIGPLAAGGETPGVSLKNAILEKAPLLAMGGAYAAATLISHSAPLPIGSWEGYFSPSNNVARGGISYLVYIKDLVWPSALGIRFYNPLSTPLPAIQGWGAWAVLALLTFLLVRFGRRSVPAIVAGWLWYLISLFPVSGVIPTGSQWTADRYTYVPHILLVVGAVWMVGNLPLSLRLRKASCLASAALILGLLPLTVHYLGFWKDSVALTTRAVALDPVNVKARTLFADALKNVGPEHALAEYAAIMRDFPGVPMVRRDLAMALWTAGRRGEAVSLLQETVSLFPAYGMARILLADCLFDTQRLDDAAVQYRAFIGTADVPTSTRAHAHNRMGLILRELGRHEAASREFEKAAALAPENGLYRFNLAVTSTTLGDREKAVLHYLESLRLAPDDDRARINLAERLFRWGDTVRSADQFREVARRMPGTAEEHFALGRLAQMRGNGDEALEEYRRGLQAVARYPQVRALLEKVLIEMVTLREKPSGSPAP